MIFCDDVPGLDLNPCQASFQPLKLSIADSQSNVPSQTNCPAMIVIIGFSLFCGPFLLIMYLVLVGTLKKTHMWIFFGTVLFPFAIRNLQDEQARFTLIRLSRVMHQLTHQEVREETESALSVEIAEALSFFQRDLPRSEQVISVHLLKHLGEQRLDGAEPLCALDMFAPEHWHG